MSMRCRLLYVETTSISQRRLHLRFQPLFDVDSTTCSDVVSTSFQRRFAGWDATTMNYYLEKGYAEKIPKEQLQPAGTSIWYLPHHPVTHPAKPEKVRIVFDCAATYQNISLNQQLLQGTYQTNQLVGVLIRFRKEGIGSVSDIESMFH